MSSIEITPFPFFYFDCAVKRYSVCHQESMSLWIKRKELYLFSCYWSSLYDIDFRYLWFSISIFASVRRRLTQNRLFARSLRKVPLLNSYSETLFWGIFNQNLSSEQISSIVFDNRSYTRMSYVIPYGPFRKRTISLRLACNATKRGNYKWFKAVSKGSMFFNG